MRAAPVAFLGLCLAATACATTWRPQSGPTPEVVNAHAGETVRVLRKTDVSVVLSNVQMIADSVVGDAGDPPHRVAIPLSDVQMITIKHTDTSVAQTGIKMAGTIILATLALAAWGLYEITHIGK